MRTKNSLINIFVSCLSYGIIMVGSFVTRQMFANILGLEMVGIEGAFLQFVNALGIVELGLGVNIVYKLYKPIAEKDWEQVAVILKFLRKCYAVIGIVVASLGISLAYFVVMPISKKGFSKIWLIEIFLLYVIDVVVSYLYSHKRAMFIADQKNYINNLVHIGAQILMFAFQISALKLFASFEVYLICKIFFRFAENFVISFRFGKKYNFVNLKIKKAMSNIERKDFFRNLKALFLHKIAGFGTTTVSSLIIVYYVSLRENGIYYNYMLIVSALTAVTQEIFNGVLASFGNLLNTESRKKVYGNFNILYFMNFLMYSFITTSFVCLATPFIGLWIGEHSAFNMWTTVSIASYVYIYGMRQSIGMAKVSAGIYDEDKYLAVIGALVTFVASWILVKPFGISGVMIGNLIGILSITYWAQPYLVYDGIFKKSVAKYHYRFALYTALTAGYSFVSYMICSYLHFGTPIVLNLSAVFGSYLHMKPVISNMIAQIVVNGLVCVIIPNVMNVVLFCRTEEFKGLFGTAKSFFKKIMKK